MKVIAFFLQSGRTLSPLLTLVLLLGEARIWAQDSSPTPPPVYPSDWVVAGQHLHHVKVLEVGADFVSVSHDDGGGEIALSTLSPDLQKLFNYPHPLAEGITPHGLHYKDLLEGTGDPARKGDLITFTLTSNSDVTKNALKDLAATELGVLQAQKATLDTALTAANTKYQALTSASSAADQQKAGADLQAAQKQVDAIGVQIAALETNTYTIPFGDKDLLPNLTEVLSGMKAGGKRVIIPPAPPKPVVDQGPITVGMVSPTPTPTPTPVPTVTAPPPLAYQVEVTEIVRPEAQ